MAFNDLILYKEQQKGRYAYDDIKAGFEQNNELPLL